MTEDELILTHVLGMSRSEYYLQKPNLTVNQQEQFELIKARRLQGEPLQYLLGTCNFMGLEFKVDSRVLVPRPETEVLVDLAIKQFKGLDILDIGTGSGCIAITLAKKFPHVEVTTIDISAEALKIAQENAKIHKVEQRIKFINEDIKGFITPKRFDLIISNPPYIPSGDLSKLPVDVKREPQLALDGGVDGLDFYRVIIKMIPRLIRPDGCLMMEFGDGQEEPIKSLLEARKIFSDIQIHKDLTGKNRIVSAA